MDCETSANSDLLVSFPATLSLQHIAFIKVASCVWSHADIKDSIFKYFDARIESRNKWKTLGRMVEEEEKEWKAIEDEVITKLKALTLPTSVKEKLLSCYLEPIGLQIRFFIKYHDLHKTCHRRLPEEFHFTPQGSIDGKKAAQMLVKMDDFCLYKRYELACMFCLEADILILSEELEKSKTNNEHSGRRILKEPWLVKFYSDYQKMNAATDNHSMKEEYVYIFKHAATTGNEVATRHFFNKLPAEERDGILMSCMDNILHCPVWHVQYETQFTDVLCFLLSVMDRAQQMEILKRYSVCLLRYLLQWPWQNFFMKTAHRIWSFLSDDDYCEILYSIYDKVEHYRYYDYKKVFGTFLREMPSAHKRYAVSHCMQKRFMFNLHFNKDEENVKLIRDYYETYCDKKKSFDTWWENDMGVLNQNR